MTTSGEYSLDLTTNDIISEALSILQAEGQGEPDDGSIYNQALNSLNMMLKLWEAQGIHLWTMEEYTLFFVVGQASYDLTDSSTRVVNSFNSTELAADAASSATSVSLDSVTNVSAGQVIGIVKDDYDIFWSVVERLDGTTAYLKDALDGAASDGNIVRVYDPADQGSTALAAAAVATDNTITLDSVAGIAADYIVGIIDDTNTFLWTTVNSVDTDNVQITLNDAITGASAIGNTVLFYSSEQNFIPVSRIPETGAIRRHSGESSDYEIPVVDASREEYFQLPNKTQQGTVIQVYYDRQEPQGTFYVWNTPSTAVEYLNFTAERQIQIMVDTDDTFDLPAYWYDAITYQLAKRLIPKIGCSPQRVALIRQDATEYLDAALAFDTDIYPIRLEPQMDHG